MNCADIEKKIVDFIKNYSAGKPLIIGVSGGVDSGVVSTLCAIAGNEVFALGLPGCNTKLQNLNMESQLNFLKKKFSNVKTKIINLSKIRDSFFDALPFECSAYSTANMQSRIRMVILYSYANQYNGLVAGTGNKNEDFILYFFTKYGDGGVDFSPIGNLYKSEVFKLASYFKDKYGMPENVATAIPTDGLWNDGRTDEMQLGLTYDKAEFLWKTLLSLNLTGINDLIKLLDDLSFRKKYFKPEDEESLKKLIKWNLSGRHKSIPPPICE